MGVTRAPTAPPPTKARPAQHGQLSAAAAAARLGQEEGRGGERQQRRRHGAEAGGEPAGEAVPLAAAPPPRMRASKQTHAHTFTLQHVGALALHRHDDARVCMRRNVRPRVRVSP